MSLQLVYATVVFYVASLAAYCWFLYGNKRTAGWLATVFLAGGLVLHYFSLLARSRWVHSVPYDDLYGSMSLFGWLLAAIYLGLETYHRQRSVGPFVLPFVLVLFLVSTMGTPAAPPSERARGVLFALHVTLNITAYSAFALSFVLSLIYLLQNQVLRRRHPGAVFWRFPPLEGLERMSRSSVLVGLGALLVGAVIGTVWEHRLRGHYLSGDPKEIVTLGILVVYGGYLWLSGAKGWRGARASALCVCNFVIVIFSYTVVNLYLSRFHRYF